MLKKINTGPQCLDDKVANVDALQALEKLKIGNEHFVSGALIHHDICKELRKELLKVQHPFAIILSCYDSRVPPEIIFDQGLGDIVAIRNAGNVLDEHVIGSIEYAVVYLGVRLVVVMGHQDCAAVAATVKNLEGSKFINSITKSIRPAVEKAKHQHGDIIENSTINNAKMSAENLVKSNDILKEHAEKLGLVVVPAYYHMDTGVVEFFE